VGNITSFAAFKEVQAYLEGLALVQRMEVVTVNAEGVVVRLTTEADTRLLTNTLALGRRLALAQPAVMGAPQSEPSQGETLPEGIDAEAMADFERALASEQMPNNPAPADAPVAAAVSDLQPSAVAINSGTLQDPLIYVWQK
jgi:hypothetical protein